MVSKEPFCVGWSNAWRRIVPCSCFQVKLDFFCSFLWCMHIFFTSLEGWMAGCESWHKGQCRDCWAKRGGEKNWIISFGQTEAHIWVAWPVTLNTDSETWIATDPDQSAHTEGGSRSVGWPRVAAMALESPNLSHALQIPAVQPAQNALQCGWKEKAEKYRFCPHFNFTANLKEHAVEETTMWAPVGKVFFCLNTAFQFPWPGHTLLTFGN